MSRAPIPTATTGMVYTPCLINARAWLAEMVERAKRCRDPEAEREAQFILDNFDDASIGLNELIASANEPRGVDREQFWRESQFAADRGLGL